MTDLSFDEGTHPNFTTSSTTPPSSSLVNFLIKKDLVRDEGQAMILLIISSIIIIGISITLFIYSIRSNRIPEEVPSNSGIVNPAII